MIIQHNMAANNTNRQLGITNNNIAKSTEKLASGYRINRAADDAAGLSISEKMRGQIRGLEAGSTNAQNGISLIQTAEGAMNEIESILQRMRELTVQASNDTNVSADRRAIYLEVSQLMKEIDRIASQTEFNTMKLLKTEDELSNNNYGIEEISLANSTANLQVGANTGQTIQFVIGSMNTTNFIFGDTGTAISAGLDLKEAVNTGFTDALEGTFAGGEVGGAPDPTVNSIAYEALTQVVATIDQAIAVTSMQRSYLGAIQNRLEHTILNADNGAENMQSAESRIRDVNMAQEMVKYSKDGILQQAGQSMLAQANQSTQGVLSLLR